MKTVRKYYGVAVFVSLFISTVSAQNGVSDAEKALFAPFEKSAQEYVSERERLRKQLPKLSDETTPEKLVAHKEAFQKKILAARANAKQGDLFTPQMADILRRIIKREYRDWDRSELRKTVLQAETKGVVLKVNGVYPDENELVEMSPALLIALPQMPKELRYRFVGTSLLLTDRDSRMIIDFMRNALP